MANYEPISLKAAATISAYRIVKVSAAQTANIATAATDLCIGISKNQIDTGLGLPIAVAGVHLLEFNDTVTAGGLVAADASGKGVPHVNTTAGSYVIGKVLDTVAATGTIAEVLIQPHFKSIP